MAHLTGLYELPTPDEQRHIQALKLLGLPPLGNQPLIDPYDTNQLSQAEVTSYLSQQPPQPPLPPPEIGPQGPSGQSPLQAGPSYQPVPQMAPQAPQWPQGGGQPQYSTLDRIMNALGGAGMSMTQNRFSSGPLVEMAQQRQAFNSAMMMDRAKVMGFTADFWDKLKDLPEEVQNALIPMGVELLQSSGIAGQGMPLSLDANSIREGFLKSKLRAREFISTVAVGMDDNAKEELARLWHKNPAQARQMIEEHRKVFEESQVKALYQALQQRVPLFNQYLAQQGQSPRALSIDEAIQLLPPEQAPLARYIKDLKPEDINALGLMPQSPLALTAEAAAKAAGTITGGGGTLNPLGVTAELAGFIQQDPGWPALSKGLPFIQAWQQLRAEDRAGLLKSAETLDTQKRSDIVAGAETAKRTFAVSQEARGRLIKIDELLKGNIVAPEAGIKVNEADINKNIASITPDQEAKFGLLAPTKQIIDIAKTLSDRLITAKTAKDAWIQGARLLIGAKTGSIPEAAAYMDAMTGYVTNLNRTVGGERGVLTDRDRTVMLKAAIASLFDTQQAKDIKHAILHDIYKAHHTAIVNEITKVKRESERSQLDILIDKLDKANRVSLTGAVPKGMIGIYNPQTGQVNAIHQGNTPPKGWKLLNE